MTTRQVYRRTQIDIQLCFLFCLSCASILTTSVYGNAALREAIEMGDLDLVKELIEQGENPNEVERASEDKQGNELKTPTALYSSVLYNQPDIFDYLVDNFNVDPRKVEWKQTFAPQNPHPVMRDSLETAIDLGYPEIVERLLAMPHYKLQHPEDQFNRFGHSLIHRAAGKQTGRLANRVKVVELLANHGYDVNLRSRKEQEGLGLDEGSSPLHMAAKRGIPEIVKKLIDLGADVNALDVHGNNPLHAAALDVKDTLYNPKYPREGLEKAVDILINAGTDREAENKQNFTPYAVARIMTPKEHKGDKQPVKAKLRTKKDLMG